MRCSRRSAAIAGNAAATASRSAARGGRRRSARECTLRSPPNRPCTPHQPSLPAIFLALGHLSKFVFVALAAAFAPLASAGLIQYDNWSGNVTADYHVTINDDIANFFTVRIQVDPGYQADVLAFGFNNGDRYNSSAS